MLSRWMVYLAIGVGSLLTAVAQSTATPVKEATIKGQKVRVGDEAYKLQDNVRADNFISSHTYGESSRGTYVDKGVTYVVTFGPPRSGGGAYVITQIQKTSETTTKTK
jgi:hypothetical protein